MRSSDASAKSKRGKRNCQVRKTTAILKLLCPLVVLNELELASCVVNLGLLGNWLLNY